MSLLSNADWEEELVKMREHERSNAKTFEVTERSALISSDERYRYTLWRGWAPIAHDSKLRVYIMLNPSTADDKTDDNTIRKCIYFAQRDGFQHMMVVNLYAFRSTDPAVMLRLGAAEARGPDNIQHVWEACANADQIVLAWGNPGGPKAPPFLALSGPFFCLGVNADGSPKHPLYLSKDTPVVPWIGSPN